MPKTRSFRAVNGRIHFKCSICQTKRMVTIPITVRRRSFRCHKCSAITRCDINRRSEGRELQTGLASMMTDVGREMDVNLYDKSRRGLGIVISHKDATKISIGQQVQLRCSWNPHLLGQGRFMIQSVKEQRVGLKVLT